MSPTPGRRALWLLPIVFAVCAVMVLPGAALLSPGRVDGPSAGTTASLGAATAPVAPARAMQALPSLDYGTSGHAYSPQTSGSLSPLSSATSTSQYAKDLSKIASTPGLPDGTAISALARDIAAGKVNPGSVYLPNLNLLESGPRAPGQGLGSAYTAEPAPMGIGDFGIGGGVAGTPYAYNTSHFAGSVTLDAANATYPGAPYFVTPPYNTNGSYNTPYEFGIQLNTVLYNISIPWSNTSSWWTQNVVALNGNILQFEDNIWNFSNPAGIFNASSLLHYNGHPVQPSFYYDYANSSIPLAFPVTINLYNNVSIVNKEDQITFGYRVVDADGVFTGIYDRVVFNNPWAASALGGLAPPNPPGFQVNGFQTTPLGLNYDAELIFGGPGGGSNAVFNNITGSESLSYSNVSSGGWKSVPSAYDWGTDTGETSIGVAETWSPGGTVGLSPGPSFLYGLWNSKSSTAVPSGKQQFQGSMTPSYGFMFMDPNTPFYTNTSYLPTNQLGEFDTYLPPGTYDWYSLADAFARSTGSITSATTGLTIHLTSSPGVMTAPLYVNGNGQAQAAAADIAGWTSGPLKFENLSFEWMKTTPNDVLFFAHLNDWGYVSWNLFQAVGVTDTLHVSNLYQGDSNLSGPWLNNFFMDGPPVKSPPTLLGIMPQLTYNLQNYSSELAFYQDSAVQINEQFGFGYFAGSNLTSSIVSPPKPYYNLDPAGGGAILWGCPAASVQNFIGVFGSYGGYIAGSANPYVNDVIGVAGGNGADVVGSSGAVVNDTEGLGSLFWRNSESLGGTDQVPFGVWDLYSPGGVYTNITGVAGGVGAAIFDAQGAKINDVLAEVASPNATGIDSFAIGVLLNGAYQTSINDTLAENAGAGVVDGFFGQGSLDTSITNLTGVDDSLGVALEFSEYTSITNWVDEDNFEGGLLAGTGNTTITDLSLFADDSGVVLGEQFNGVADVLTSNTTFQSTTIDLVDCGICGEGGEATTTFLNTNVTDALDEGILFDLAWETTITNLNVTDSSYGAYLEGVWGVSLTNVVGWNTEAVYVYYGWFITATDLTGWFIFGWVLNVQYGWSINVTDSTTLGESGDVWLEDVQGANVAGLTGVNGAEALVAYDSEFITASGISVSGDSWGVLLSDCDYDTVSDVTSADPGIAVQVVDGSYWNSVSDITASNESAGVLVTESQLTWVSDVTVTNMSVAVFSDDSSLTLISGVTATNTTLSSPYAIGTIDYDGWILPALSAVATIDDSQDTLSNVVATNYPVALWEDDSDYLGVNNVNSTGGYYGIYVDDSSWGSFNDLGIYRNLVGLYMDDSDDTPVTGSSFVDNTLYGVALDDSYDIYVYDNSFIGNNGAGSSYSAAHIQAYSSDSDSYFYFDDVGNYWSDWHTYNQYGELAPYPLGGLVFDYYPLGGPEGSFGVWFYDYDLASGVSWSVTFNGATQTTTNDYLVFYALPGTYAFTAGAVPGYTISPASGNVTVSTSEQQVNIYYSGSTMVTVTETGLPAGATWTAIVGGASVTGNTPSLSVGATSGEWNFQISGPANYSASPSSGTITVGSTSYALSVVFSKVMYSVTISESGLSTGTSWSATVNGVTQTSSGTSVTFSLPNGTYTASIGSVSGYSTSSSSVPFTVNGASSGASVSFSANSSPSLVSSSTFNTWLAVAIAIAVIALILGLLALMARKKSSGTTNQPPEAWNPPPAGSTGGATGGSGAGGSSGAWSEGSGPGTPPSS
jgi:parallel beta-helix repeat protein